MTWQAYREPVRATLLRTVGIAVVVGGVLAWLRFHDLRAWPAVSVLVLWFSLGGHYVEVGFLNGLRPRLPSGRAVQAAARIAVWLVAGAALGVAIRLTMPLFAATRHLSGPPWWGAAGAFVVVGLVAHAVLAARRRPSFYDGRG